MIKEVWEHIDSKLPMEDFKTTVCRVSSSLQKWGREKFCAIPKRINELRMKREKFCAIPKRINELRMKINEL